MTIQEILGRHIADVCNHGDIECRCGEQCDTPEAHRAHLAEVLDKHMQGRCHEAWALGAVTAWDLSTPEVNGKNYHWRHDGEPVNPYRKDTSNGR